MHYRSERARGFTLVELLFTIAIIFLIMGLLLGGIRHVMKFVKGTGDAAMVQAVKSGVTQFSQTFGFAPPLVKDGVTGFSEGTPPIGPLTTTGEIKPVVYTVVRATELNFLRFADPAGTGSMSPNFGARDGRFSLYSIPYFVMGSLDVDGVPGPGFRAAKRDGSFEKSGRTFNPFFDPKGNSNAVVDTLPGTGRIELRDAHGVAIRYYRWKQGRLYGANYEVKTLADMNIPWMLGDANANAGLKSADYAIVAAGPNGLFGDEFLLPAGPGSPPSAHPQWMSGADFMTKLGRSGNTPGPDDIAAAMADNIVVVGTEAGR